MLQVHRTWAARAHSTAEAAFHTDMRLSRNARGLLAELLALPDDAPRDIRSLAGTGPDGYMGTASGFKELERFGYVTRQVNRHKTTGQMWTEVHIYDTPLESPESEVRDPGCQCSGDPVIHPNGGTYGEVNTSLPEPKAPDPEPELPELHWEPDVLPPTRAEVELDSAARLLASLGRMDRRLSIGAHDATRLAPYVLEWFARGATAADIRYALTGGLPDKLVSAAGLLENRLTRKMPLPPAPPRPPAPKPAAAPRSQHPDVSTFIEAARTGAARARAALRGIGTASPALA
jgi:hypothetical protein